MYVRQPFFHDRGQFWGLTCMMSFINGPIGQNQTKNRDPKAMKVLNKARIRVEVVESSAIKSLLSGPILTV